MSNKDNQETKNKVQIPEMTITESKDVLRPSALLQKYNHNQPAFDSYKFLMETLMNYTSSRGFQKYTIEYKKEYMYQFGIIADMVFDIEKHNADHGMEFSIINYLRHVKKIPEEQLAAELEAISEMKKIYGSIENGLANLAAYARNQKINSQEPQK